MGLFLQSAKSDYVSCPFLQFPSSVQCGMCTRRTFSLKKMEFCNPVQNQYCYCADPTMMCRTRWRKKNVKTSRSASRSLSTRIAPLPSPSALKTVSWFQDFVAKFLDNIVSFYGTCIELQQLLQISLYFITLFYQLSFRS